MTKACYAPGRLSPTLTAKRGEAENWRLLCREQRGIALAARCLVLSIVVAGTIYVSIGLDGAATNVSDLTFTVCRQAVWTEARRSSTRSPTLHHTWRHKGVLHEHNTIKLSINIEEVQKIYEYIASSRTCSPNTALTTPKCMPPKKA